MPRGLLYSLIIVLLLCLPAHAATFFLSESGGGAGTSCASPLAVSFFNTGSNWANPKVSGKIGPGDTVQLCGTIASTLTLQNSGNSGAPVTVDGVGATLATSVAFFTNNQSWWILQNGTWASGAGDIFLVTGGTNGIIQGMSADNLVASDVVFFAQGGSMTPTNMTVRNNFFRMATTDFGTTQHDMIVAEGMDTLVIEGNYLEHRIQGQGGSAHNDIVQTYEKGGFSWGPPTGLTLRYNWFVMNCANSPNDRSWTMLETLHGTNEIYGNVFLGLAGAESANGMAIEVTAGATFNVFNNTFVAKSNASNNVVSISVGTGTVNFRNNILHLQNQTALTTTSATLNRSFNHWFGSSIPSCGGFTGELCGSDPLFTNYASNDFSLQAGSPDKGAGTNLGSPYDTGIGPGATWPNPTLVGRSVPWDRGAFTSGVAVLAEAPKNLRYLIK